MKRYAPDYRHEMTEHPDGAWVAWSDVATLIEAGAKLAKSLHHWRFNANKRDWVLQTDRHGLISDPLQIERHRLLSDAEAATNGDPICKAWLEKAAPKAREAFDGN